MATSISSEDSRNTDDYMIIWLDSNSELSNVENQTFISQLRSIVNTIETFSDLDQCFNFLKNIRNEDIVLIISDRFVTQIASLEKQFTQINSIYILSNEKSQHGKTITTNKKIQGVFTDMKSLYNKLIKEVHRLNTNSASLSIVSASDSDKNELEPSFMYFQLLKENILAIEYNRTIELQNLIDYCHLHVEKNVKNTALISKLEHKYHERTPIWWYTLDSFLYGMLNRALRTMNIDILLKMGFFIQDLHEQIKQRHSELTDTEKPRTVYRGLGMFNKDFEKLLNAKGCFFTFNYFASTSTNINTGIRFAHDNLDEPKKTAILFEINIDPTISSVPFASVADLSEFPTEDEILFSMSTVFRIGEMEENYKYKGIWKVNLSLTSDRDPLLKRLTDHMRNSLGAGDGWRQLGQLMIKMGNFDKALEFYQMLLKRVDPNDKSENAFLHNQLGYVLKQQGQLQEAFSHYEQALKINRTYMSDTDPRFSSIYSNIGGILKKLGDANSALRYYELVLKIDLAAEKPNPLEIAVDHNNIGSALDDQGKYPEALKSYEEALHIKRTHLPPYHPSLASTYSNIGLIHRKIGDYSTALTSYEKTLEIQKKSLTPNHPSFVVTYGKLATVCEDLHKYKDAIKYVEQAVDIAKIAFGPKHPETEKRQKYLEELQRKI